jgi:hypothetical protein
MFIEKTTTESQEALFSFGGSSGTFETDSGAKVRYQDGSTYGSAIAANDRTHIAWVRDNSKGYIYVDGTLVSPSSGISDTTNYTATAFAIGSRPDNGEPFTGYIDNLRVVVGTAVYTSNFTVPSTPLTAVTNTKLLTLTSPTLADTSGQSVSLTNSGVVDEAGPGKDVLFDVPTNGDQSDTGAGGEVSGNYPTLSPIDNLDSGVTLSNGNLHAAVGSGTSSKNPRSTIYLNAGKWYWEMTVSTKSTFLMAGIATSSVGKSGAALNQTGGYGYGSGGNYYAGSGSVSDSSPATFTTGDVIGVKWDADAGTLEFFKNNTSQGTISSIPSDYYSPAFTITSGSDAFDVNFGQRAFSYSAPTNHKPICTTLLPTPTIADGSAYFDTALYTGNGSTQTVSGLNMSPDLVWMKTRSQANDHVLVDSVRGVGARLFPNDTIAENTQSTSLTSFNSDGFSLGSHSSVNQNNVTHVAWAWDAGSSTVSNTDGSITSSVRASTAAGFSIVTATQGSGTSTWGHGLNTKPDLIIMKARDQTFNWYVSHSALDNQSTKFLRLDLTSEVATNSNWFNSTEPTNSVVSTKAGGMWNQGDDFVAYCWNARQGFSAFGLYEGNGSSSAGPFIFTDFRVNYLLVKNVDTAAPWFIFDAVRDPENTNGKILRANDTTAEFDGGTEYIDFLSNGFKLRTDNDVFNKNGDTYAYWAIAENPFQANGGLAR